MMKKWNTLTRGFIFTILCFLKCHWNQKKRAKEQAVTYWFKDLNGSNDRNTKRLVVQLYDI